MLRAILIALALCLSGLSSVSARDLAPPEPALQDDPAWKPFNELIESAKGSMMGDPAHALDLARDAEKNAESHETWVRWPEALATSLWLQSEALARVNQADKARPLIDRALELARRDGKDTKLDGDLNLSLGRIADLSGDIGLALRSFHTAHDIFASLGDPRSQSMALQNLGSIYDEAHDFKHEIEYYKRASQVFSGDPALELSATNNLADAFKQLGRYDEALQDFERALKISEALKSSFLQARILTNIASVHAKRHELAEAEKAANTALKLLGKDDDSGWSRFTWAIKAEIEYDRGSIASAIGDLAKTFNGVDLKTTTAPFRDIHEIAYKVFRAKGDYAMALAHHEAFKRLDDEGSALSANANLALMGAQFDFANQQLEIEHLKTEQLKRDVRLAQSRADAQRLTLTSVSTISGLALAWFAWGYFSIRRHRNAINKANIQLQHTVNERDAEIVRRKETEGRLREAKDEAEQASRSKTQFLANMSHELRTPLNAIIGFAEIMDQELLGAIGTPAYKGYANDILGSSRHLLAILSDILDMAHIDAGKTELCEGVFNLGETIADALQTFQQEARVSGKTIEFANAEPDLMVRADERILRQILINLVSNAVKFTPAQGRVDVRIERPAQGGIDLVVADNGIGIPKDMLGHVMERFGQVADAFARSRGGVGLGLPIVKSLAELHGGTFTIESGVDQGTTARVHLPPQRISNQSADHALAS